MGSLLVPEVIHDHLAVAPLKFHISHRSKDRNMFSTAVSHCAAVAALQKA
jgi:hypothetical protein